jgi:hypothetical protein
VSEGLHPYGSDLSRSSEAMASLHARPPAVEYGHGEGCCVIGGRVYRGPVAALRGLYFYADECGGWIETFRWRGNHAEERTRWRTLRGLSPSAFGEDASGELYVLDLGGRIYRIAGAR